MIRRPPRSTLSSSSAASDVYKRQLLVNVRPVPRFVPVPPGAVHQVTMAPVPVTPLAVRVVVPPGQTELTAAVAEVIATSTLEVTVTLASTADPQSPVTLAK